MLFFSGKHKKSCLKTTCFGASLMKFRLFKNGYAEKQGKALSAKFFNVQAIKPYYLNNTLKHS
jgi:hypothetical protein